ncbi:unnamed protein product, partial [Staurois parvus]
RCRSWPQLSITRSQPVITRRHPVIAEYCQTGERTVCKQYNSLPCQLLHTALYGIAELVESTHSTECETAHS